MSCSHVLRFWVLLAVVVGCLPRCLAAETDAETDPLVLKKLDTFQDWKFGFMMHWGIYSQWGSIESWPLVEEDKWARPDDLPAWIAHGKDMKRFAADYVKLNQTFHPRHFDPQLWADAAKRAGMKYVVFTTKHHDGFCLFDTKQTDFRTTHASCPFHTDPRADVVKAVFDTFRREGFGIGAYYSKSDWHQPGYWDAARPHVTRNPNYDTAKEPERWATFVGFTHRIIEEIVSSYGPIDILWLDGGQVRPPQQDINMPAIATMARQHQPGLIIVDRTVGGRYENYCTPEQEVPAKALPCVWETCMTMGDQWSYKPNDKYKSPRQLIHLLVDVVAKGGNFLLNVGPDADGQLPAPAVERLEAMGRWMRVNGEAIYGTRAVAPYKVGRTCLTKKGSTIYLIYLADKDEAAPPQTISVPAITGGRTVRMLGADTPVKATFDGQRGLTIEVPEQLRQNPPCEHAWAFAVSEASTERRPIKQLFHNEDCTNLFFFHQIPAGKAGELIDHYVDVMAQAGVTTFLCNTNARRTNYRSRVWESFWDGYDPAGADDQPFLATIPRNDVRAYRNLIANMLEVHRQGVDYPARVIQRCRQDAISPWITLRMNDRHFTETPDHPFHGSFWKKNPQLCRKNCPGSYALCLDYAHQEVRDYYRALIVETLERYDIDGLELDFMREPYLFSAGKEAEGAPILTGWIRQVRKLVEETAAKRGHPIRLGVRVPSRPETALGMGLDAITWAKEGLIDLLVVTPRWATLEFDMPLGHWRQLLGSSKVTLAGGLEILCRPAGEPPVVATPELATGAAISVLSEGADAVYLFNHFQDACPGWPRPVYLKTLKSITSLDDLLKQPRCVAITYRDVTAPGEDYRPPLPVTGKELAFSLKLGPIPDKGWGCELRIGLTPQPAAPAPTVLVNGKPCTALKEQAADGLRWISFVVPMTALKDTGAQLLTVASADHKELTVRQVQMCLRPADAAVATAAPPIKQLFHNEDETNIFYFNRIPPGKAGEFIDHYVDVMAQAGVTTFLCNTNARRTNYRSRVWDAYWDGYDPAGPDNQPFLAPVSKNDLPGYRKLIDGMLETHRQGIDYPARVVARCRHDGMSPWITLRMNDCHLNDIPTHPFHGSFWRKNPQFARQNCTGYFATCLDYAHPEVRDFYRSLVVETLERYDVDGLELDFMREPYLFSAGKEAEGRPILTGWLGEMRKLVTDAAAKRGHPIRLGVRVPSRPETAFGMGLDAVAWAKAGLIDLLVVTPRWATLEYDMPLPEWRRLLAGSKVILAGGLEIICRPAGEAPVQATPELATGAALSVLAGGADAVYLFNYFQDSTWPRPIYLETLKAMTSLETLVPRPRAVQLTFRDVTAPGEDYRPLVPATGKELAFPMKLGPLPGAPRPCELLIGLAPACAAPTATVNGKPCQVCKNTVKEGVRLISFTVPMAALAGVETHQIKLSSKDKNALMVQKVEMSLKKE